VLNDILVSVLDILSKEVGHRLGKPSCSVQRTHNLSSRLDYSMSYANPVIVLSEERRLVYDSGTRILGNISVTKHSEPLKLQNNIFLNLGPIIVIEQQKNKILVNLGMVRYIMLGVTIDLT
jgi:hypothetical protein